MPVTGDDACDRAEGFRVVEETELWKGHVVRLCQLDLIDPNGESFRREVVRHPGAVAVVPVGDDGTVTLVRQYRSAVGEFIVEVPAGTRDVAGEPPQETARRELREEAGLEAARFDHLATVYNSPGYSDQVTTIFLATQLQPCATDRRGIEERSMGTERIGMLEALGLVSSGRVVDSTTALALVLARDALNGRDTRG